MMKAMVLNKICDLKVNNYPLEFLEVPVPVVGKGEILIKVSACAVCHTELDEIEGRTPSPLSVVIPGHQVVGRIVETGVGVDRFDVGDRVGAGWIYSACGSCSYCLKGDENLCQEFVATGRDVNGGYAEYMILLESFAHSIPESFSDEEAAPLLCAGAIGYRSLALTKLKDGMNLGLTGFGASAHIVIQMARHKFPEANIYVFARSKRERAFALELGACWAGGIEEKSPELLNAVIDTTPAWKPVLEAMENLKPGGRLVINAIRKEESDKEELLGLDYSNHLWQEKEIKSVANITRRDVREFLQLAVEVPIKPDVQTYALKEANRALLELKEGKLRGAKVLRIG